MAKILGFINAVLRGKLGGSVYSANAGGEYIRQYVKPINPNTQAQATARGGFTTALSAWHSLTSAEKQDWATFAMTSGFTSGINAFMSLRARAIASERLTSNPLTLIGGDETLDAVPYAAPITAPSVIAPPFSLEPDSFDVSTSFTGIYTLSMTFSTVGGAEIPPGTYTPGFGITAYMSNIVSQESHFKANPLAIKYGSSSAFETITAGTSASTGVSIEMPLERGPYKMFGSLSTGQNYARISAFWESVNGQKWLIGSQTVPIPPPVV